MGFEGNLNFYPPEGIRGFRRRLVLSGLVVYGCRVPFHFTGVFLTLRTDSATVFVVVVFRHCTYTHTQRYFCMHACRHICMHCWSLCMMCVCLLARACVCVCVCARVCVGVCVCAASVTVWLFLLVRLLSCLLACFCLFGGCAPCAYVKLFWHGRSTSGTIQTAEVVENRQLD